MAKRIDLNKAELIKIVGNGMILDVRTDNDGRILVRVESEMGGRQIIIKQHEEDARCIAYEIDHPCESPLTRVK